MRSRSPEVRNRSPNRSIVLVRVRIHVSGIGNLSLRSRVHAVDLAASQALESWQVESLAQSVDTSVLEELITSLVDGRGLRIAF